MTDLPRVASGIPGLRQLRTPRDAFTGAVLSVELGRARLRLALLEEELDERASQGDDTRRALDFVRELLEASVIVRVGQGPDPQADLQTWLEVLVRETRSAFPEAKVKAAAVASRQEGRYELAVGANLPPKLENLLPAPDHRDFPDCVRRHAPNAKTFPFTVDERSHWFVVLADGDIDTAATRTALNVAALEMARAMRRVD